MTMSTETTTTTDSTDSNDSNANLNTNTNANPMTTTTTTTTQATPAATSAKAPGGARVFATLALTGLVAAIAYAGTQAYRAATDSFVAPAILSPESELVLQTKAKMAELDVERSRITVESEAIDADLAAGEKALDRLNDMKNTLQNSLDWTKNATAHSAASSWKDLQALSKQRAVLTEMADKQGALTKEAKANLQTNLITKADESKERIALNQVQLALIENERSRAQTEATLNAAYFAQKSLAANGGHGAMMMPEAVSREEQIVRIELEMTRLESEQRRKRTEKKVVVAKLAKMDELEAQLKGRPLFRATQQSVEVAFVPYSQSEGVVTGATVYDCTWSIFNCKPVGTITEVVPGEVILPDPWGSPARGQYAVLGLSRHESAKSKVLRVRGGGTSPAKMNDSQNPQVVSAR
jgi:hypothetical protein